MDSKKSKTSGKKKTMVAYHFNAFLLLPNSFINAFLEFNLPYFKQPQKYHFYFALVIEECKAYVNK